MGIHIPSCHLYRASMNLPPGGVGSGSGEQFFLRAGCLVSFCVDRNIPRLGVGGELSTNLLQRFEND